MLKTTEHHWQELPKYEVYDVCGMEDSTESQCLFSPRLIPRCTPVLMKIPAGEIDKPIPELMRNTQDLDCPKSSWDRDKLEKLGHLTSGPVRPWWSRLCCQQGVSKEMSGTKDRVWK